MDSSTDMINKIFEFIANLANKPVPSSDKIRFVSGNGKQEYWFVKDSDGISVWIVDVGDTKINGDALVNPWEAITTVGARATYTKDMSRLEIDWSATNAMRAPLYDSNNKEYYDTLVGATATKAYKDAYDKWYNRNREISEMFKYKSVWHRITGTNIFHVGGSLRFSQVSFSGKSYKTLDCHYNDGTFSFNLYSNGIPYQTRSLIVGEFDVVDEEIKSKSYILSSSFIFRSNYKPVGHKDAFCLPSVVDVETDREEPINGQTFYKDLPNFLFKCCRCDIDYDSKYVRDSFEGVPVAYRVNINLDDYIMPVWSIARDTGSSIPNYAGESYKLTAWDYRQLYTAFEHREHGVGVSYWSVMGQTKKSYMFYDDVANSFKNYSIQQRSGPCGNTVNTKNNVSEIMPIIFYVLRDPDDLNSWSAIGHTDKVGYVNMYNMSSGRTLQSYYDADFNKHYCYNLWKKRCAPIPYCTYTNPISDLKFRYNASYGVGGLAGLAIRHTDKIDYEDFARRWVDG